jgi:Rad3-related DNA helicase
MVLTSGTISPMEMYAKLVGLENVVMVSVKPQWLRNSINPLIVTKASD